MQSTCFLVSTHQFHRQTLQQSIWIMKWKALKPRLLLIFVRPCVSWSDVWSGHRSSQLNTEGDTGRVCSGQGGPCPVSAPLSPGLITLRVSGDWSHIFSVFAPSGPCPLCERPGLTCNRFPWWAMSDCWSRAGHWPGHKLAWRGRETSAWSEATSDRWPGLWLWWPATWHQGAGHHCSGVMKGSVLKSISIRAPHSCQAQQSPVINVMWCASCQPSQPYLGYLMICRVINLLKETFGRGAVRAEMMTTEWLQRQSLLQLFSKQVLLCGLAWLLWLILFFSL